jgi:S-formylglutathione hydrolase FrmB
MKPLLTYLALLATAFSFSPAWAGPSPDCVPPRCVVESMTIGGYEFIANVSLPPGYDEPGNVRRYPVLYLYPGGTQNRNAWLESSDLLAFTAALPSEQQAIVVLPSSGFFTDSRDGSMKWETFHVRRLIPLIDSRYRTIAARTHRAIAGLSFGGYGTMHYAARHPDLFVAAGSLAGIPQYINPASMPLPLTLLPWWFCGVQADGNDDTLPCGGYRYVPGDPIGPWGSFVTDEVWWRSHDPGELAPNLQGISLYVGTGNGVPCDFDDAIALTVGGDAKKYEPLYHKFEALTNRSSRGFVAALDRAGVAHRADLRSCGLHSWRYFFEYLQVFWPQMVAAWGNEAPSSFDFRSVERRFSAWEWTFETDPQRATEFLDVSDASSDGLTLTGSGVVWVTTAALFAPGGAVNLIGAVEPSAVADAGGRITFHVDLGPAHDLQQYTPAARALETTDGYWKTTSVTFSIGD